MTKTSAEIEKELKKANTLARTLRSDLKRARAEELVSAKQALGEAVAALVFAETTEAIQALVQTLNDPVIADEVRRVFSAASTENSTPDEHEDEPRWGSDEGDDLP
ncbi:hypothetical protein ACTUM0_03785 [Schaalia turicensis]|uniref:hypothetical protein n=1 Tax=Schaalia turicensis TaxID=131111 RepID=UPI003FA46092